jgi:SAM-dependent methyltransferase
MTNWFEPLYKAAERGEAEIPWHRGEPNPLIERWARGRDGTGLRAVVVGSGTGDDAEMIARLGFETTAFDVADTAVAIARRRFPDSPVDYRVADLLEPPLEWAEAFDLVVESITVQALPVSLREAAIAGVRGLVAPGGTLIVFSGVRGEGEEVEGPPWPLTRSELESFARGGLEAVRIEQPSERWLAEFRRPGPAPARGAGTAT